MRQLGRPSGWKKSSKEESKGEGAFTAPSFHNMRLKDRNLAILLILPSIVVLGMLVIYPLLHTIYLSLHSKNALEETVYFLGLENYRSLFFDPEFWHSLKNGLVFTFGSVILALIIGTGVALVLNEPFRGRSLARSLVIFPYLVSTISVVLVWRWMLDSVNGIVNYLLLAGKIIPQPLVWFGVDTAMLSVILVNTWKYFPFVSICVLARLQTIPEDLYSAAKVDGARWLRRFWDITLPQLKNVILIVIILRFIWNFNNFDLIWLLTQGGPAGATQTLPHLTYIQAFPQMRMGLASTTGVLIMIVLIAFYLLFLKIGKPTQEE